MRPSVAWAWEPIDDGQVADLLHSFAGLLGCECVFCHRAGGWGAPSAMICSSGSGRPEEWIGGSRAQRLLERALGSRRALLERLVGEDARLLGDTGPLPYLRAAAVRAANHAFGVLFAASASPPDEEALASWQIESCAATLALCLAEPSLLGAIRGHGRIDMLTGCLTYGALEQELRREMNRSARARHNLSVLFIDLDGFKRVNDRHGHLRGNDVLAAVGAALRTGVRSFDVIGRFGGDEFVALLPNTNTGEAVQLAQRVRDLLQPAIPALGHELSASIGVAQWQPPQPPAELIDRADLAMLGAKADALGIAVASPSTPARDVDGAPRRT